MAEVENQSEGVRPGDQSEKLYNKIKEIYGDELDNYRLLMRMETYIEIWNICLLLNFRFRIKVI